MPMKTMSLVRMISNDLLSEYRESAKTAEGSSRKCHIQGERKLMIKYFSQINKFIHLHNLCWFTCIVKDKRKKKHWKVARILTIGKSPFHSSTCDVRAVNGDLCKLADYLQSSSRDTALIRTLFALHWEGFLKELLHVTNDDDQDVDCGKWKDFFFRLSLPTGLPPRPVTSLYEPSLNTTLLMTTSYPALRWASSSSWDAFEDLYILWV